MLRDLLDRAAGRRPLDAGLGLPPCQRFGPSEGAANAGPRRASMRRRRYRQFAL